MKLFPKNVNFLSTERIIKGGSSSGNFENFNLAFNVNDRLENVIANRSILKSHFHLPSNPVWINQIHSSICVNASKLKSNIEADAIFTSKPGEVCGVLTADCLPVFVSNKDGSKVGVAHAGWRGLINGVIESLVKSFNCEGNNLIVHLGPAISLNFFEVGEEIKELYLSKNENFNRSFSFNNDKHYLDLYEAARIVLDGLNVELISGGNHCTFKESGRFFSYRRDGINSGRMAHLIWIA
jgi:polyphenol oxidase